MSSSIRWAMTPGQIHLLIGRHVKAHRIDDATPPTEELGTSRDLATFSALL